MTLYLNYLKYYSKTLHLVSPRSACSQETNLSSKAVLTGNDQSNKSEFAVFSQRLTATIFQQGGWLRDSNRCLSSCRWWSMFFANP